MKPQKTLLAMVLALSTAITGLGNTPLEQSRRVRLQALRASPRGDVQVTLLELAYLDTAGILDKNDGCSQFFGGAQSRLVLEELVVRLREHSSNDSRTGLRMSGRFDIHVTPAGAIGYRLFERAELNTVGPFYKAKTFSAEPFVPNVGSFRPNTREARVLILLHELAHLIKAANGSWLVPDDGGNSQLSRQNTMTVESQCELQIRALR